MSSNPPTPLIPTTSPPSTATGYALTRNDQPPFNRARFALSIVGDEELRLDYNPTDGTLKITTNRMVFTPNPIPDEEPLQVVERTSVSLTHIQQRDLFHVMKNLLGL